MRRIGVIAGFIVGIILISCEGQMTDENISRQEEKPYEELTREMGEVRTERVEDIYIHIYSGIYRNYRVNTYIIEGRRKLVVIDTQHLLSRAKEVRDLVDYLDKPVEMVVVSHSHPDHYMGITEFRDLPIYATEETIENMKAEAEEVRQRNIAMGDPYLGDYPEEILYPENILKGDFSVDGVEYQVVKTIDTEDRDGIIIKIPQIDTVFAGDLVEEGVHLAVIDPDRYIAALEMILSLEGEGYEYVLSGHGDIYSFDVVEENIRYLHRVKEILGDGITRKEYKRRIEEEYPDYGGADYVIGVMAEDSLLLLPEGEE